MCELIIYYFNNNIHVLYSCIHVPDCPVLYFLYDISCTFVCLWQTIWECTMYHDSCMTDWYILYGTKLVEWSCIQNCTIYYLPHSQGKGGMGLLYSCTIFILLTKIGMYLTSIEVMTSSSYYQNFRSSNNGNVCLTLMSTMVDTVITYLLSMLILVLVFVQYSTLLCINQLSTYLCRCMYTWEKEDR